MSTSDSYRDWLEDFNREVDKTMREDRSGDALQPASVEHALAGFDDWWRKEGADLGGEPEPVFETEQINKELEFSRKEVRALKEELDKLRRAPEAGGRGELDDQLRKLAEERGRLQARIKELTNDNEALRRQEADIQGRLADLRIGMSRAQDEYETQIKRLGDKTDSLNEQIRVMTESRQFLQNEYSRQSDRLESFEAELKAAFAEKRDVEGEKLLLEKEVAKLEDALSEGTSQRAALEASVAELRRQATELHERLVRSHRSARSELTEAKRAVEDLARKGEKAEGRLAEQQGQAEARLRETTRYLEMKLKEMQEEYTHGMAEFRDLMETLSRFGEGAA